MLRSDGMEAEGYNTSLPAEVSVYELSCDVIIVYDIIKRVKCVYMYN